MKDNLKELFFPFFVLFLIFSDELFSSFLTVMNIAAESGMKSRLATFIAIVSYLMLAIDLIKGRMSYRNGKQLLILGIILSLYIITGFTYPHSQIYHLYVSSLLVYGALSIPAAYVGMRLARGGYEDNILHYLPYFLVVVTFAIGYMVLFRFSQGTIMGAEENDVMSYQGASYAMSFCCAYCIFYVFWNSQSRRTFRDKIMYCAVVLIMFMSAVGCIVGGGRGAFLYLIFVTAYLVYRIIGRERKRGRFKYFLMLAGAAIVMVYLANRFQIFESAGAIRVAENLTKDEVRDMLRSKALASFKESPIIGHGIGSVWWEVGYYAHNMILDFMVEMGLIGTIIMIMVIIRMLHTLIVRSNVRSFDMFILLILLGNLVEGTFSGYWISLFKLFLVFGYVYGLNKEQKEVISAK